MKLRTINKLLRLVGLVLVLEFDWEARCKGTRPSPTRLWLETAAGYDERTREAAGL